MKKEFNLNSSVLNLIDFYKPKRGNMRRMRSRTNSSAQGDVVAIIEETKEQVDQEIKQINKETDFDNPETIDFELLQKGLQLLKQRKPFNKPSYDQHLKIRKEVTDRVDPTPVVIVEGHLIFNNEELRKMFDLSVFIDTDDDVRLSRRVLKNSKKDPSRQVELSDLLFNYEHKTKPAFEKWIEPTKKYADIIIPNYGFSTDKLELNKMTIPAIDLIIRHIETHINRKNKI